MSHAGRTTLYIIFLLMMTKHVNRHRDDDVHSEILHFINVLNLFYKFFNINIKHQTLKHKIKMQARTTP